MKLTSMHIYEGDFEPCQDPAYIIVPTTILKELSLVLRIVKLEDSLFKHAPENKTAPNGSKRPPPIFQRLKKLAPKGIGQLTHLTDNGRLLTRTQDVERAVRMTRGFWTQPPPELSTELQQLISEYGISSPPFQHMPLPPADLHVEVFLGTGDTATGSDRAPLCLITHGPAHCRTDTARLLVTNHDGSDAG